MEKKKRVRYGSIGADKLEIKVKQLNKDVSQKEIKKETSDKGTGSEGTESLISD